MSATGANIIMNARGIDRDYGADMAAAQQMQAMQANAQKNALALQTIERESNLRNQLAGVTDVQAQIDARLGAGDIEGANTLAQMQQRQGAAAKSNAGVNTDNRAAAMQEAEIYANAFANVDQNDQAAVQRTIQGLMQAYPEMIDADDLAVLQDPNARMQAIQGATDFMEQERLNLSRESGQRGETSLAIDNARLQAEYGVSVPNIATRSPQRGSPQGFNEKVVPTPRVEPKAAQTRSNSQYANLPMPGRKEFPGGMKGEGLWRQAKAEVRDENKFRGQLRKARMKVGAEKVKFQGMLRAGKKKQRIVKSTISKLRDYMGNTGIEKSRVMQLPDYGYGAGVASYLPGDANKIASLLKTLTSVVGFGELADMRANSKTGGAVGNLSEREFTNLAAALGDLDITNPNLPTTLDAVEQSFNQGIEFLESDMQNWDSLTAESLPEGYAPEASAPETFAGSDGKNYVLIDGVWNVEN